MSSNLLFDFLNDINSGKKDIMTEENEKEYKPYVINRFLANSVETVRLAAEMSRLHHLTPRMQYDYLLHSVRRKKRFLKWTKADKQDKIDVIKKFYDYSTVKAAQVAHLFSDEDVDTMRKRLNPGGTSK